MNQYVTGAMIRQLREKNHMTQSQLAKLLCEKTGMKKVFFSNSGAEGYPDISLLEPIAGVFGISITELLAGNAVSNGNVSANMMRSMFYVCPVCGNIIHSMGAAAMNCHGILLTPAQPEETDEMHRIVLEKVEDEYYIEIMHEMTKSHYISFIAAISSDGIQTKKLYPEGNAQARFKIRGVKKILFYCNRDGLFQVAF